MREGFQDGRQGIIRQRSGRGQGCLRQEVPPSVTAVYKNPERNEHSSLQEISPDDPSCRKQDMFCLQSNNASLDVGRRQRTCSVMNENKAAEGRQVMTESHGQGGGWHRWAGEREGPRARGQGESRESISHRGLCRHLPTAPTRIQAMQPVGYSVVEAAWRSCTVVTGAGSLAGFLTVSPFLCPHF